VSILPLVEFGCIPFGAAAIIDGKLCIVTNNQKVVYQQLKKNPKIEISGMARDKWIRLCAEVSEDDRRSSRVAMMKAHPELVGMYNADDGIMVVFAMNGGVAQICSFF